MQMQIHSRIIMKEMLSAISNTAMTAEGSDSNSVTNQYSPNKLLRHMNTSSPTRFKGVVLQQNGHWGAQIYANHQRIWLGTFKSEKAAAMAYDSAAIKLRSGDTHRNFPWTSITIQEPSFQDLYSTEAVLNMIKDGSYESKFADFLGQQSSQAINDGLLDPKRGFVNQEGILYQQLFQKELTPSDVGKLNRLVIPKKHAIKYFPLVAETSVGGDESDTNGAKGDEVQLEFLDSKMRSWKFRYCYWKSSQSFVFTRGWNRFVKDKVLKAKDVVVFYECRHREVSSVKKPFLMIDVACHESEENVKNENGEEVELQLGLGGCFEDGSHEKGESIDEEKVEDLADVHVGKRVKLFGIEIN